MATKKNTDSTNKLLSLQTDLLAAGGLGLIAGGFAAIVAANLDFLGKTYFGIGLSWPLIVILFVVLCEAGILVGRYISKFIPAMYSIVKFAEAGGLNWLVDLGVVSLLVMLTHNSSDLMSTVFKGVSFTVAVTNSYFWNKQWVFSGHSEQDRTQEAGKFLLVSVMGLVFNLIVFSVVKIGGPSVYSGISSVQWVSIGTVVGSLSAMIFNFTLYKVWVFKVKK